MSTILTSVFTKSKLGGYREMLSLDYVIKENERHLGVLGTFLCDSVGDGAQDFIDWIYGLKWQAPMDTKAYSSIGTNTTHVERDGEVITLIDVGERDYDNPSCKFVTSRDEFVQLLKQWGELYKQQPKEIVLTVENGKYTLECRN